jgi:hypothetical protein
LLKVPYTGLAEAMRRSGIEADVDPELRFRMYREELSVLT